MSREEHHFRDRLLLLAECSNPHRPHNVKRKPASTKTQAKSGGGTKFSMQDFVRRDPGYTPDIEHLVFPAKNRTSQPPSSASGKTRSRLAEMFALSRHLHQRSTDHDTKPRNLPTNRSVDSAEPPRTSGNVGGSRVADTATSSRRWVAAEEPVRQTSLSCRFSPAEEVDMTTTRGPNVSILHLRNTSEPWETNPTVYTTAPSRSYSGRSTNIPLLTKHQSLSSNNSCKWNNFHSGGEVGSGEIFTTGSCSRELSPVRWCDREVDGVYLGRSGWVQVQQRSLDESRRNQYENSGSPFGSLQTSRRTAIKLADYHCNSEPSFQRPIHLPLHIPEPEDNRSPSPPSLPPSSPPSITPIISPPPAFQDRKTEMTKSRTFFGKPFLPRSNAIDSDIISPPASPPPPKWNSSLPSQTHAPKSTPKAYGYQKMSQTKSLEDTTASRRSKFLHRFGESSSSSSSSMGFRSLDSFVNRSVMPKLSENSNQDIYEDADEESNNSSLNLALSSSLRISGEPKDKISPTGRSNRLMHHRTRRSPVGSDTKQANSSRSSSSSGNEYPVRSNAVGQNRRTTPKHPSKMKQDDLEGQKVRRSRSLQLPDKKVFGCRDCKVSPQHSDRVVVKIGPSDEHFKNSKIKSPESLNKEFIREAEAVTKFLNSSRSRAAAQALIIQRYKERNEERTRDVGGNDRQKVLHRGSTAPNLAAKKSFEASNSANPCNSDTCDFWPHCAHRDSLNIQMRLSQSYPSHQKSFESQEQVKKRLNASRADGGHISHRSPQSEQFSENRVHLGERRLSPNRIAKRDYEKRTSPVNHKRVDRSPVKDDSSNSSSSSDVWVTTSDRTNSRSPKNVKGSGGSTPIGDSPSPGRKSETTVLTRPGSALGQETNLAVVESEQRSMSLPKSFLSSSFQQGVPSGVPGNENPTSSPGLRHIPLTPETSQTAPVTPSHEINRRHSPLGNSATRRTKATSTPQLIEKKKWPSEVDAGLITNPSGPKTLTSQRNAVGSSTESVLQKFKKSFSLRFQKKGSKEGCNLDVGDTLLEALADPPEGELLQDVPLASQNSANQADAKEETADQKYRFGPLIWRSSKDRRKTNKAARKAKCNSGDSGIQVEMVSGCGGAGGDSSESHDTDPPGDELDSPPTIRRRIIPGGKVSRPHSDLLNQIRIDKFKFQVELQNRAHKHHQVRRTRSDLGGQRILQWDPRTSFRRLMSSPAPIRGRPQRISPRKKPPDAPGGVQLRGYTRHGQLRRSLSQPVDIDKLSPLLRTKAGSKQTGANVFSEDEHEVKGGTSDDDMSDSESSIASFSERKKSLELAMDEEVVILAEAVFDHVAIESEELAFRAGDVIEVLETVNRDWWWGSANGAKGWFPAAFVRLRVSQEDTVEDCLAAMAAGHAMSAQLKRRTSISLLSNDQVRTSVVRELVHTERDFVKVLQDVVEGYISECRKRKDMFSPEQITAIFINLEEILRFQSSFLTDLESCIVWDAPYQSCVGNCFIKHRAGFKMYSDYCNSHPMATATLQELYQFNNYSKFFEACRLMRGLIEIPLDGYLLTPVQRICKYPLQLAELLKYTKTEHPDHEDIRDALETMKGVAVLINERKRRMESLEKLAAWQHRVEGWEGDDLIEVSSQLIHQGEVVRVTSGMWTSNITLFLFDHQIIYCKKDILKRSTYVYKGRMCLDTSEVIDVVDGKDAQVGVTVRHAIKVYSCVRDKWLLFCCRSSSEKQRWLQAFTDERKLVNQDRTDGLEFPHAAKQLARVAARCQRRPPRKHRGGKNYKLDSAYMGSSLQLNSHHSNSNSLGRKVGTWFTFGANRKSRYQHRDVS